MCVGGARGGSELVTWRRLKRTAVAGAATAAAVAVGGRARGERGSRGEEDVTRVEAAGTTEVGGGDEGSSGSVGGGMATLDVK